MRPLLDPLIDAHVPETAWENAAACRGLPPDNNPFFQEDDPGAVTAAKAICAGCAPRPECLEQALLYRENDNLIWGGLTPPERRTVAKRRRQQRASV